MNLRPDGHIPQKQDAPEVIQRVIFPRLEQVGSRKMFPREQIIRDPDINDVRKIIVRLRPSGTLILYTDYVARVQRSSRTTERYST